jgi:hypothetical protein
MYIRKMMKFYVSVNLLVYVLCSAAIGLAAMNLNAPVTANFQNTDVREALQTLAAAGQAKLL